VYKDYNVEDMVKKNIHQSKSDESYKDLSQQIYLILYELPYARLYILYAHKRIGHFITGIIKNQRTSPYLEFNKHFKLNSKELSYDIEDEYEEMLPDEYQSKVETINYVMYKLYPLENINNLTDDQRHEFFCIEILKMYLKKKLNNNYSFTKLSQELKINRSLISDSIQNAKVIIRREYNKNKK